MNDSSNYLNIDYNYVMGCDKAAEEVTIPDGVTAIFEDAFANCTNLKKVVIPDSVTKIWARAFEGCTSLKTINIPDSVTEICHDAFKNCKSLETFKIPHGVSEIADNTFHRCESLRSITISESVLVIKGLGGLKSLAEIIVDENNENYSSVDGVLYDKDHTKLITYPAKKEGKSFRIHDSVTEIGGGAFKNCTFLETVDIPDSVTTIHWFAFFGCTSLKSVTVPGSVTKIEDYIFTDCTSLETVNISNGVGAIGYHAFERCISLKNINVPDSVTEIDDAAFVGCISLDTVPGMIDSLKRVRTENGMFEILDDTLRDYTGNDTEIVIPEGVKTIAMYSITHCSNLETVKIPEGVVTIKERAIDGCDSLKTVEVPASVAEIGRFAFSEYPTPNCAIVNIDGKNRVFKSAEGAFWNKKKKLLMYVLNSKTSFDIPDGITKIGSYAFCHCKDLVSVNIPDSVTAIEEYAFHSCSSLKSITLPDGIRNLHKNAFKNCPDMVIIYRGEEYPVAIQRELSAIIRKNKV